MKIVIDTNIVISGIFFGGYSREILKAVTKEKFEAYATNEIIIEYYKTVNDMIERKQGNLDISALQKFSRNIRIVYPSSNINICRDPDDDKFIECAVDAKALYIISGDKDLLTIKNYDEVEIITAKDFCEKYLSSQTNS